MKITMNILMMLFVLLGVCAADVESSSAGGETGGAESPTALRRTAWSARECNRPYFAHE